MCGELDEEGGLESALYARFRSHAQALLRLRAARQAGAPEGEAAYMDALFADALSRTLRDGEAADDGQRYNLLAAQPVVFARLAGFLAAHAALSEDPLRKVIEAVMHGYAEAERIEPDHSHDHDHDDDHHHGHAHPHDHHH